MKRHLLPFLILTLAALGCSDNASRPRLLANSAAVKAPGPIGDLTTFLGKSPKVFEKAFGPAEFVDSTDAPDLMPGEWRDYRVPGLTLNMTQYGLVVQFYKGRSIYVMADLPEVETDRASALIQLGMDMKALPEPTKAIAADRWESVSINNVQFKEIVAIKNDGSNYTSVQLFIEP